MKRLANIVALVAAALGALLLHRNRVPRGMLLWFPKLLAGAVSPFAAVAGAAAALLGLRTRSLLSVVAGSFGAFTLARYVKRVSDFDDGFACAFGRDWETRIPAERRKKFLKSHWTWALPAPPRVPHRKDVPFAAIPGSERELLCDLWLPPNEAPRSGLAFIYLHGSAWYLSDKDVGTRFLFRRLAAQGHVIMDVAYRLWPDTDLVGMVGDAKRAVAWMKQNAAAYGVDPGGIVIGGGSAGAHLALLAAYAPDDPALTPEELSGLDLTVRGAVSIYGPLDMAAVYEHTSQGRSTRGGLRRLRLPAARKLSRRALRLLLRGDYTRLGLHKLPQTGGLVSLLGGTPEQAPERYRLLSPLGHVHPGCPATLLVYAEDDLLIPVASACALDKQLRQVGTPVVTLILPRTDHGFDLVLPRVSPPAQAGLYELERFLAVLAA